MKLTQPDVTNTVPQAVIELEQAKKEYIFQQALRDTGFVLRNHQVKGRAVFISYAWEDEASVEGKEANEKLQGWLRRLSQDLEKVGVTVFLDIEGMKGKMAGWMEQGIAQSDYIIVVGTARYKTRANQGNTNVAFEYQRIVQKLAQSDNQSVLLPLLYSGDFANSFPSGITDYLIRDFRQMEQYYHHLLGLVKPIGMVPNIYPVLEKGAELAQEYGGIFAHFYRQLTETEAEATVIKANKLAGLLHPAYELPVSSAYFVGRVKEMEELNRRYQAPGYVMSLIEGIGGTGKSQLAAEYAHQSKVHDRPYRLIRWLKADSQEQAKRSYFQLGEDIGIKREDYKEDEAVYKRAIDRQLLRYERLLLIYDNVEALEDISAYQPPAGPESTVHVLVTTRHVFDVPDRLVVKEFNALEVQMYLQKRLDKTIPYELAQQLGAELGYLPLAIVQSAAYMVKYHKTLEDFLKLLQGQGREKVLNSDNSMILVSNLWRLTLEKLSTSGLATLQLCAYLEPDTISSKVLTEFIGEQESDEVLYELRSQSLLTEVGNEGQLLRIHRLLQESLRRPLTATQARTLIERGIAALKAVIGERPDYTFWKERPLSTTI